MTLTFYAETKGGTDVADPDADAKVEAERAYQRALSALHGVRAELAEVAAAQRRLAYQRRHLVPAEAAAVESGLTARYDQLAARAAALRTEATGLRDAVRRFAPDDASEPAELPPVELPAPATGYEQPPFSGPQR